MILTQDQFIEKIARRTADNTRILSESLKQRRNQVTDLNGVEYTRQGSANFPATFYISISPDMVYLERYEFKLIISSFLTSNGIATNVAVPVVEPTRLTLNGTTISPNPHTHELTPHTHGLNAGIGSTPVTASDFRVFAEGLDISAYLASQHDSWISGEGVYPDININHYYDMLKVASVMHAEGKHDEADLITKSGYKRIQISSGSPFSVTMVLYCKYPHLNR